MSLKNETTLPWYRHRWPWLLMLGPFLVIVAAAITLWLAIRSDDGLVADDYYKQGLSINQETSRNRRAAELGLTAQATYDPARRLMRVVLKGDNGALPNTLLLKLSHPTRGGLDQSFTLQRDDGGGYSASSPTDPGGRWYASLEDDARQWRLTAEWNSAQQPVLQLTATEKAPAQP